MTKLRLFFFLLTIITVGSLGYLAALYARGYRFNQKTFKLSPSGILVVKSDPDSAQILINGTLSNATNTTISLAPGIYDISIKKDGYLSWNKRIAIEKEVVTSVDASLFRSAPALSPATFSGVVNPIISPDFMKIIYSQPLLSDSSQTGKTGLWSMETLPLPFGFARDPKKLADGDFAASSWNFSPDQRLILLFSKNGAYLLDTSSLTPQNQMVNILPKKADTLSAWSKEARLKLTAQAKNLPEALSDLLENKSRSVVFSPDGTKILYTASASATLADGLIKPLPGSSTQKQERTIKPYHTYVYDIKEDRNFLIDEGPKAPDISIEYFPGSLDRWLFWLPNSKNLVATEKDKIIIMDYDNTNRQTVYSGSYITPYAYPFGTSGKLIILTNLGADSQPPNLYYLSLK